MGLIDILTQYDAKKKAAHAAKTVKHGVRGSSGGKQEEGGDEEGWGREECSSDSALFLQAGAEISTVHPEQYAKRFLDFIANIFA